MLDYQEALDNVKEKFIVLKHPEHYSISLVDKYGNFLQDFGMFDTKQEACKWSEVFMEFYVAEGF